MTENVIEKIALHGPICTKLVIPFPSIPSDHGL